MDSKALIPGLTIIPNYISDQKELLDEINKLEWETSLSRRVQQYIRRYDYKSKSITKEENAPPAPEVFDPLISKLIDEKFLPRYPEQILINEYTPGQGIAPHVDSKQFGSPVISLSLGSSVNMVFQRDSEVVQVYLTPGTLVVMDGEARNLWTHGIVKRKTDDVVVDGVPKRIPRGTRVSITFRVLAS